MAIALPVSRPHHIPRAISAPAPREHARPSATGTFFVVLALALFVGLPWAIRPLEAFLPAARVALIGQIIESLLGVTVAIWMFRVIRRQGALARRHATEIERLTEADALTGLGNQRALARELELALNRARRTREAVSVLVLDLNAAEEGVRRRARSTTGSALRMLGAVVRSSVRFGSDAGYRIGESSLALVVAADRDAATAVCRRLEWNFRERNSDDSPLGVGVATWDGNASSERLIEEARKALVVQRQTSMVAAMA